MSLQDLAREYAALVPDWARPGMRCVDPKTGDIWRRVEHVWVRNNPGTMLWFKADYLAVDHEMAASGNFQSLMRAIAAGPDLADAATVVALLGVSGQVYLRAGWWVANVNGFCAQYQDRTEAIIRACIAQAKGVER